MHEEEWQKICISSVTQQLNLGETSMKRHLFTSAVTSSEIVFW